MTEDNFIVKKIVERAGSSESSKVELVADTNSGETYLEIQKTITERFPVTSYKEVMDLYDRITAGGGRRVFKIADFK